MYYIVIITQVQFKKVVIQLDIIISNNTAQPIYEQITNQIKRLVMEGELKAGDHLPSMRSPC